jgi:hypothetical protein
MLVRECGAKSVVRRKFGDSKDVQLLKEVMASNAQVSQLNTQGERLECVEKSLSQGGIFPWPTDGKHCPDIFKLIVAGFKRLDRIRAQASGTEDDFSDRDQLLYDICSAIDDADESRRRERGNAAQRETVLRRAGDDVRASV